MCQARDEDTKTDRLILPGRLLLVLGKQRCIAGAGQAILRSSLTNGAIIHTDSARF